MKIQASLVAATALVASSLASTTTSRELQPRQADVAPRIEWHSMDHADRVDFVQSIKCLMETPPSGLPTNETRSLYDEFVWVHSQMTSKVHGTDSFLPWHRYYLYAFHSMLSSECGYAGPQPWWDETLDAGDFSGSSPLFTPDYFGTLEPADPAAPEPACVSDGPFAGATVVVGYAEPQCLSRGENQTMTAEITGDLIDECQAANMTVLRDHRMCVEGGAHSFGHMGVGPVMANVPAAPADPVFWMHHGLIDWQWARWQGLDPEARTTNITGCSEYVQADPSQCDVPLTVDTVMHSKGLFRNMTAAEVLDTEELGYTYDYF